MLAKPRNRPLRSISVGNKTRQAIGPRQLDTPQNRVIRRKRRPDLNHRVKDRHIAFTVTDSHRHRIVDAARRVDKAAILNAIARRKLIAFCEWTDSRPKVTNWFALDESRPLFAFAGIWRLWTGERKGETREHHLFSFLTTEANDIVRPIHAKAMPVLLTTPEEWDIWLGGSVEEATALQRPLPVHLLKIVAAGEKSDAAPAESETGAKR